MRGRGGARVRGDEASHRATILELLTVVFNNIKVFLFEGEKITKFCV